MDTAKGIDVRDVIENLFDVCDVIDAHVIVHRLRDKQARGEPIAVENFVRDTIKLQKAGFYVVSSFA